ncbi:MAG: LptF/LptG family permease [bacterium]
MRIITKYILKEHISPFLFGIGTIIFLFILNILFRDLGRLLGKGLSLKIVAEFFLYQLAWIVALAVPMAVLIASLMVFGKLSSENEITALKASGIPIYSLIFPVLVISFIIAVGMIQFNNYVYPESNHRLSMLYSDISRKKPTLTLEPNVFFDDIKNYNLLVHSIDNNTDVLHGIIINDSSDPKFNKTIFAETGRLYFSKEHSTVVFSLNNGEVHEVEKTNLENYRRLKFNKHKIYIPISNMVLKRSSSGSRGLREKSTPMLQKDIKRHLQSITKKQNAVNKQARISLEQFFPERFWTKQDVSSDTTQVKKITTRETNLLVLKKALQNIHSQIKGIKGFEKSIAALKVEVHKKYSIPIACIVFVLIGAPVGIMARQGGMAVGWGIGMIFFLIYWAFLIGGEQLADRGLMHPVLAMWLANIVVGIAGVYFIIHAIREQTFIQWNAVTGWLKKYFIRDKQ